MRNAGLEETQAGIKTAGRNINNLRYADDTILMTESEDLKSLLRKVKEEWKSWLKTQHSENEDHGIQSYHFMANRWRNSENSVRLYFWGLQKSLQMVTAAMKLNDAYTLEEKIWPTSVRFSCSVVSDSLRPHESQHARPPCPSPTPGVQSDSRPSSQWCHPAISSSVVPFSSCPQSLPASESFPMSQLFTWGGPSIGVSALASFLPKNTQDWSPLEWTGWISLQSKGLSRVFSNTTVQKHQFFGA